MRHQVRNDCLAAIAAAALSLFAGCIDNASSDQSSEGAISDPAAPKDLRLGSVGPTMDDSTQSYEMASGYLLHRHSGVSPWCAGVLVDPTTVLTAAHCVEDVSARDLSIGFGALGADAAYQVSAIHMHSFQQPQGPALYDVARLTLNQEVLGVRPVTLATSVGEHEKVSLVSYTFVLAGQRSNRRVFAGNADTVSGSALSAVFDGADTNCHGESGAGLFRRGDGAGSGELLGIAANGSYDPPHPIYPECLGRIIFAPIGANLDLMDVQTVVR